MLEFDETLFQDLIEGSDYTHSENEATPSTSIKQSKKDTQQRHNRPVICTIGPNDIVCGRNKLAHNWIGNKNFRKVIEQFRESYQTENSRSLKTMITYRISDMIHKSGGRFLKHNETTGFWYEISNDTIHEKISHALRSAKDPNRPRKRKEFKPRKIPTLTTEQEVIYQDVFNDQQQFFNVLKNADSNKTITTKNGDDDDIDSIFLLLSSHCKQQAEV